MVVRTEAEFKEKIEYGFELFYNDVLEKKDIRHFFFGITLQKSSKTTFCTKTL